MNYSKRSFDEPSSVVLPPILASQRPKRNHNWTIPYRAIAPVAMAADAAIILATGTLSGLVYHFEFVKVAGNLQQFAGFAAVVLALFLALTNSRDLYTLPELLNFKSQVRRISTNWILIFLFLTSVGFAMKVGESFSRGTVLAFAVSGLIALIGMRIVWRVYLADGLSVRRFASRKIALIGEEPLSTGSDLFETLTQHGLQPAKHFVLPMGPKDSKRCKEVIAKAISSIRGSNVEEIVLSFNMNRWPELEALVAELRVLPLPVNLVPAGPLSQLFKLSSHTIGDTVTIEIQHGPRTLAQRFVKRVMDIVFSLTALLAFLPLFLITVVAIKLDSNGPVLFRQRRRGFNGRPFQIFKFRTMTVQEDGDRVVAAQRDDCRVTRVGNWLRRTSIDELPQLLNVLLGSMSVVGPRPHALVHDTEFEKLLDNYAYRHHVKPGLTGWAQIHGYRGEMRTIADIEKRVQYDLAYIDSWSLALDFRIILRTVTAIMDGKNAY